MLGWRDLDHAIEAGSNDGHADHIFFAFPYRAAHSNWIEPCCKQLESKYANLKFRIPNRSDGMSRLLSHIVEEMAHSGMCFFDITGANPNVCIELGIATALGKPLKLIRLSSDASATPADAQGQNYAEFSSEGDLLARLDGILAPRFRQNGQKWNDDLIREHAFRWLAWKYPAEAHEDTYESIAYHIEVKPAQKVKEVLEWNTEMFKRGSTSHQWMLRDGKSCKETGKQ